MSEREQLEQAIAHLESQRAILGDAAVDVALASLREKLAALEAPSGLEQRKQITVLFADVSGFTAMAETMDAEDVLDLMNALWVQLDEAITARGGLIDKHIGDAVMALFGAPTAREDDPERAIRAALAMQAELAAFREARDVELAMRIGVNTGPVLLGEAGTTREYTAMGDTVNLASRLEHAAPVGGILISHDTYRHVRGLFEVQPLEPISVKGKVEPVQVYVVLEAKPRAFRLLTRGVEGIETPMVGREIELRWLQEALSGVIEEREAELVTVVGEAGVGKSRLLYEFRNWLELQPDSVRIFQGRATQEMTALPFSLVRDLLAFRFEIRSSDPAQEARAKLERGIVEFLGAGGEEQAHFIGQLIGFDFSASPHLRGIVGDARQVHDRAFHYLARFFAAVAADSPVAVYLEDAHWADDGSLDLVDYLARECRGAPLFIVALTRPVLFERRPLWGEGQEHHARLELRPLTKRHSRQLVGEILRKVEQVPQDLRDLIVGGAEGNPFYVEELIRMLVEDGVIVKGEDRWGVEMERLAEVRVPPTLTGVVQARLDGLPAPERETLQQASVVGRVFWDGAVEQIGASEGQLIVDTIAEEVQEALRALRGRELVFEREASAFAGEQEFIFKHAVLRDVTYESVLKRLRRVYHAQVAAWLIEHSGERVAEYAGLIGEHYERAGERAQAVEWYGRAARQAQDTYALQTALGYYHKALALEERWKWRQGQVETLHVLGRREEERAALEALEEMVGAPVFEGSYLRGGYHEAVGEYPEARTAVERALQTCRDRGDVINQGRCLVRLGNITHRHGDYDDARAWYDQALALFPDQEIYPPEEARVIAQALNGLGSVQRQQGEFEQAKAAYERALALSQDTGDRMGEARAFSNLGAIAFYQRDFLKALMYHQHALKIRQAIGDRAGEGTSLHNLAITAREAGDYGQAEAYLSGSLAIHQATGNRWEEVNVWNDLGILHQELGDLSAAETSLQRGLELSREIGDEAGQAYILSNLGPVVRDKGDLEAAENLLTDGLALMEAQGDKYAVSYFVSHLGLLSLRAGGVDQAIERATAALTMRRELELRLWTTADLAILGAAHLAAGDMTQALEYARRALAILDECGGEGPECPQQDYFLCFQVLSAAGRAERSRAALQSAYDLVIARADKITDPSLRQSFLERVPVNREILQEYDRVMRGD